MASAVALDGFSASDFCSARSSPSNPVAGIGCDKMASSLDLDLGL